MDQQTTEPSPVMSWDEWKRRMEAKFTDGNGKLLDPPIANMLAYNGWAKGKKTCGDCKHCVSRESPRKAGSYYLVCDETDQKPRWKKDWPACGKFEVRKAEIEVHANRS